MTPSAPLGAPAVRPPSSRVDDLDRGLQAASSPRLIERYREYRRRQGHALLSMLPRDGLRAILRRADGDSANDLGDFDRLAAVCESLLPLPPYSVWLRDFHDNRTAYDAEAGGIGATAGEAPVTVDIRVFPDLAGSEWVAALELAAGAWDWRGRIRFHSASGESVTRTAEIFREALPSEVRRRFLVTDEGTLRAFLRSTLP